MQRLNNKELDERIHKFLFRKFAQFPELESATSGRSDKSWHEPVRDTYKNASPVRWSLQLS